MRDFGRAVLLAIGSAMVFGSFAIITGVGQIIKISAAIGSMTSLISLALLGSTLFAASMGTIGIWVIIFAVRVERR